MTSQSVNICPGIWSAMRDLFGSGIPAQVTPGSPSRPIPGGGDNSLGHGSGVDDDLQNGSTGAQKAGEDAREMTTVYAQVNRFLAELPSQKRIAIELHYNSVTSPSARYAEVLYKGDISFAQNSARLMAAIFGGKNHTKPYGQNPRGQATFTNGPTNTYLMEPFFGSNAASAAIASSFLPSSISR